MASLSAPMHAAPSRILHTMIRVRNLDRSLTFYTGLLGMKLLRLQDFVDGRFTLAFVGYDDEASASVIELTHNWDGGDYEPGTAWGHIALAVDDIYASVAALAAAGIPIIRAAGPLPGDATETIAFIQDPDGYRIELIERALNGS